MKRIFFLITILLVSLKPAFSQHPPWYFINTVHNHIVLVLDNVPIMIDTVPLLPGDYIGTFYTFNSTHVCGSGTGATGDIGGMMLTGDVNAITVWGAEPNVFNGFQAGEAFNWKVWRASDGSIFDAVATYDIITLPDSGNYVDEGLSKLASLVAMSIPGINLSVNSQSWPVSGCEFFSPQPVTVIVQNHDTVDVTGFNIHYTINSGDTITEFANETIVAGDTLEYIFSTLSDLSQIGVYDYYIWVDFPGDVNGTNDYNSKEVIISDSPVVSLGQDIAICEGDSLVIQTDDFFDEYLWNDGSTYQYIYAKDEGYYSVTITDEIGCNGIDSVYLSVYPEPQVDLIDEVTFCEGGYTNVAIHDRFKSIKWSNGSEKPNLYITYPGTYWVTVTDFVGCTTRDSLLVTEVPMPEVNLGDTIFTLLPDTVEIDAGLGFEEYLWNTGDTLQIIMPGFYGNYEVTVSKSGCEGSGSIVIFEEDTVIYSDDLCLFPNPINGEDFLQIEFPQADAIHIDVYNLLGQFIVSKDIVNSYDTKIYVGHFEKGVYVLYLKADLDVYTKRFLIVE